MTSLLRLLVKGCVVVCDAEFSALVCDVPLFCCAQTGPCFFLLLAFQEQVSSGTSRCLPQLLNYAKRSKNCTNTFLVSFLKTVTFQSV